MIVKRSFVVDVVVNSAKKKHPKAVSCSRKIVQIGTFVILLFLEFLSFFFFETLHFVAVVVTKQINFNNF